MHKAVSRALWGAFFVGGLTVLGAGAANAADTSGEDGVASGNQVGILGEVPVTIGGNAISILGDSESSGTTTTTGGGDAVASTGTTSGEDAVLGGNQIAPDLVAPIVASGNSITVIGDSSTEGTNTTTAPAEGSTDGSTATTTGDDGIASGNQVMPNADLPIVASGNSITVIGDSSTEGTNTTAPAEGSTDGTTATTTTGDDGIASGNQVAPDVDAPIMVGGNDVAVIRDDSPLDEGILTGGFLDEGIVNDGLLHDGLLDDGLVEIGLVEIGMLDDGMVGEPVVRIGLIDSAEPAGGDGLLTEPAAEGPLVGDIELAVLGPVEVDSAVGDDSTGTAVAGTDVTDSGPTLLVATAAFMPAMMLAATGTEALPLIGGIALMLVAGLALVGAKRLGHAMV